jgi:hypothetical protein
MARAVQSPGQILQSTEEGFERALRVGLFLGDGGRLDALTQTFSFLPPLAHSPALMLISSPSSSGSEFLFPPRRRSIQ